MTAIEIVGTLQSERGLTMAEIGSRVGVTRVAVWNWRAGRSKPRAETLRKLRRLLKEGSSKSNLGGESASFPAVIAEAKVHIAEALKIDADDITVLINQ